MAKRKKLTNREKQYHAQLKKEMQEKGVIPPDKPRLNRKRFIEEARISWMLRTKQGCLERREHAGKEYIPVWKD